VTWSTECASGRCDERSIDYINCRKVACPSNDDIIAFTDRDLVESPEINDTTIDLHVNVIECEVPPLVEVDAALVIRCHVLNAKSVHECSELRKGRVLDGRVILKHWLHFFVSIDKHFC
jgi:hypothetical protein